MVLLTTSMEIACSPAHVREVFLDFQNLPNWTQGPIRSISPQPAHKPPISLQPGDKLAVQLEGMSFTSSVIDNSPHQFKWRGTIPLLFSGDHFFRFEDSKTTPGGTTFSHGEEFSGLLAVPFGWFGISKTKMGFEGFNEDLKKEAEKSAKS